MEMNKWQQTISRKIIKPLLLLPAGLLIYHFLKPAADRIAGNILGMTADRHPAETLRFFLFELPRVFLLITLIIIFAGISLSYFSSEKTRTIPEGQSLFTADVMNSLTIKNSLS